MRYYRFSRKRKPYFCVYDPKSRKKSDYMINTGRSKILSGIFFENQAWGGLYKAWKDMSLQRIKMSMTTWSTMHVLFKKTNMN